ncbi:MAG TPA: HNH endonuclease [Thermomicrobiales bacterium]|nr:HNH endonuclease [Thermomicrobiales bacterium]
MSATVLVLNQNYEPLNICNIRRAIVLVFDGKAEVLEEYDLALRSATREFASPSVIRLVNMIKRPRPKVKLTRREIFIRDDHVCQYCGRRTGDLTLDHIHPRSKGGQHTWLNLVTACRACNHRKGGKSLAEARMRLRREPFEPKPGAYYTIERRVESGINPDWAKFLPGCKLTERITLTTSSSI